MADYFTKFSVIVPLPSAEAQQYAVALAHEAARVGQGDEIPKDFPASLQDVVEDWQFETDASSQSNGLGVWLHSESGGVDAARAIIQHLLQRFQPSGFVTLEWSHDCSKPRVDGFGGGAALITSGKIKHLNTGQWLHRQVARLQTSNQRHLNDVA